MMFPYPSAEGLHVGNLFAFTGNDIYGRFQRLQGHTVFEPMGFDAFGIHSENFALKVGTHPADLIPKNIDNFRRQLKRAGLMVDWRHELSTTDPTYYKWTQWVFLQLYKRGLAYKKRAAVNWCPNDKTVLANEQVIAGECERCGARSSSASSSSGSSGSPTTPARLLGEPRLARLVGVDQAGAAQLDRPLRRRRDHVPRSGSRGAGRCDHRESGLTGEFTAQTIDIRVFTTRPDTIFGATYMVLAPEHPLVDALTTAEQRDAGRRLPAGRGEAGHRDAQGDEGEDRRLHRRVRASTRRRSSRSRSGSPTTC